MRCSFESLHDVREGQPVKTQAKKGSNGHALAESQRCCCDCTAARFCFWGGGSLCGLRSNRFDDPSVMPACERTS
jgi:hypothetical protein